MVLDFRMWHPHFTAGINKVPSCLLYLITSLCLFITKHLCYVSSEVQGSASEGAADATADGD